MATFHYFGEDLDTEEFSERLRLLRKSRNITQARCAELLCVNPRVYNLWECGTAIPQMSTVIKIADILQVTQGELTGRREPTVDMKIHKYHLFTLNQQVDNLPDEDQHALILVIDDFVNKSQMARLFSQTRNTK
jgi:transcriptional regulator with XRE-family HTH domain